MNRLFEFWKQCDDREKLFVVLGTLFTFLLIYYALLIAPVSSKVNKIHDSIAGKIELKQWLENRVPELIHLRGSKAATKPTEGSRMILVEKSLKSSVLNTYDPKLQLIKDDQVTIAFKKVPFNDLIFWLASLQKQYAIEVIQINCHSVKESGFVSANLTVN